MCHPALLVYIPQVLRPSANRRRPLFQCCGLTIETKVPYNTFVTTVRQHHQWYTNRITSKVKTNKTLKKRRYLWGIRTFHIWFSTVGNVSLQNFFYSSHQKNIRMWTCNWKYSLKEIIFYNSKMNVILSLLKVWNSHFFILTCLGYCSIMSGIIFWIWCKQSLLPFNNCCDVLGIMCLTVLWFKSTWKSDEIFRLCLISNSDSEMKNGST